MGTAVKHCQTIPCVKYKALLMRKIIHGTVLLIPQIHVFPHSCIFKPAGLMRDQPHPFFKFHISGNPDDPVFILFEKSFPDSDIFPSALLLFIAVFPAGFPQIKLCLCI